MGCTGQEAEQETEPANINSLPSSLLHAVFAQLGPKDLCSVSATCALWSKLTRDKASNSVWKRFYTSRWRVTGAAGDGVCWQSKYGSKMKQGKSWTGKYEHDSLYGHKAGIKSLKLLPSHGMLLSGSVDRTVRLWDLNYGMPLSISRPHGGIVRSVALDQYLVASGSSDNVVRLWHARHATAAASLVDPAAVADVAALQQHFPQGSGHAEGLMEMDSPADRDAVVPGGLTAALAAAGAAGISSSRCMAQRNGVPVTHGPYSIITGEADESLFDLSLPAQHLRGHIGPVTSLCLTDSCLYSGSWDYTVRCWRRGSWDCISVLKYQDWVWSVVARGGMLLVASGPEVHVHDLPTGKLVRKFQNLHEGNVSCVEGTYSGKLLFTGGADGLLMAHDLRMKDPSRVLWHHNAGVHGLALEDPWLVSAASDGTVVMHNLEQPLPNNLHPATIAGSSGSSSIARRSLNSPGQGPGPLHCVDIAESWLAAGGESPTIRLWDFTKAAEVAARAAAARAARNNAKRAKQRKAAAADSGKASKHASRNSKGSNDVAVGLVSPAADSGSSNAAAAGTAAAAGHSSGAAAASGVGTNGSSSNSKKPKGLLAAAAAAAKSASIAGSPLSGSHSRQQAVDRYHRMQHPHASHQQQHWQQGPVPEDSLPHGRHLAAASGKQLDRQKQGCHYSNGYNNSSQGGYAHSPRGAHSSFGTSPQLTGSYGSSPQHHHHHHQWSAGVHGSSPQQLNGASPLYGHLGHHHHAGMWQSQRSNGNISRQPGSEGRNHTAMRGVKYCGRNETAGVPITSCSSRQQSRQVVDKGICDAAFSGNSRDAHAHAVDSAEGSCSEGGCQAADAPCTAAPGCSYRVPFSSSYPSASQTGPWLVTGTSPRYDTVVARDGCTISSVNASGSGLTGAAAGQRNRGQMHEELAIPGSLSN